LKEHDLLYAELIKSIRGKGAFDSFDNKFSCSGSSFTDKISEPYLTYERYDTPLELMATLRKYMGDNISEEYLRKILVVASMKYREEPPKQDNLSERVYNF